MIHLLAKWLPIVRKAVIAVIALIIAAVIFSWVCSSAKAETFSCEKIGEKVYTCQSVEAKKLNDCAVEVKLFDKHMGWYLVNDNWRNADKVIKSAYSLRALGCWGEVIK